MRTENNIEIFALPDCSDCDKAAEKLAEREVTYTWVYDKKIENRAQSLGKCTPQIHCVFIENQREKALQKSDAAITMKYPFVFHHNQYIPLNELEGHDFSMTITITADKPYITIYTKDACWNCHKAKELLNEKNIKFIATDRRKDPYPAKCGQELRSAYPKVYIKNKCIGGLDELKKLDREGELERYITPASATNEPKVTANKAPNHPATLKPDTRNPQSKTRVEPPFILTTTQNNSSILISFEAGNALSTLLNELSSNHKKIIEVTQWAIFRIWLMTQELRSETIGSWVTPQGQSVIRLIIDAGCSPLLIEETILQGLTLDTPLTGLGGKTVRNYLLDSSLCNSDYRVKGLLSHYSANSPVYYYRLSPFNEEIKEVRRKELMRLEELESQLNSHSLNVHSWGETMAYQAGEGIAQGGLAFASDVISQRLQCSSHLRDLPAWANWLIPVVVSSSLQTSVSLMRYPILGPTVFADDNSEETSETQAALSALATYFFSTLAASIAMKIVIERAYQWINKKFKQGSRTHTVLTAFLPYGAPFSNLPSLVLSQSTYVDTAKALTGFAVNLFTRGTTETILKKLFGNRLLPSLREDSAIEMTHIPAINQLTHEQSTPFISAPAINFTSSVAQSAQPDKKFNNPKRRLPITPPPSTPNTPYVPVATPQSPQKPPMLFFKPSKATSIASNKKPSISVNVLKPPIIPPRL